MTREGSLSWFSRTAKRISLMRGAFVETGAADVAGHAGLLPQNLPRNRLGRASEKAGTARLSVDTPAGRRAYLERIQREHARIVTGISDQDPAEARRAMREHLTRSLERYRRLAQGEKNGRR